MKTQTRSGFALLALLLFGFAVVSANAAHAARANDRQVASCSTRGDGPDNYVGGIGIYEDPSDPHGVLRGRITDNYLAGYLTCLAEPGEQTYVCGGVWNTFGRGTEAVQARLTKTSTPGIYSFDLARRPKFYGGTVLRNMKCTGER